MSDFDYIEDDEDMEGNVYIDEKEAVLEEDLFLDKELKSKKFDDDDFYEDDDEEEPEEQKTLLDTEESSTKEEPEVQDAKETSTEEKQQKPSKVVAPIKTQDSKISKEIKKKSVEVKVEDKKSKEEVKTPKKVKVKQPKKEKKISTKEKTKVFTKKEAKAKVSKKKDNKKKKNYFWPIFISIAIIALVVFAVIYFQKPVETPNKVVAKVNGQEITMEELDKEYEFFFFMGGLPDAYKEEITKEVFLTSSVVSEVLILQEAETNGITVSDEEVDYFIQAAVDAAGASIEQFEEAANSKGLTLEDIHKYLKRQLISYKLLNETVLGEIEVTDEEIFAAYNENLVLFENQGQSFADVKDYIEQSILTQRQRDAAQEYMDNLRNNGDIEIYYTEEPALQESEEPALQESEEMDEPVVIEEETEVIEEVEEQTEEITTAITTFQETGDDICYDENGKPLVILYSTTYCPHCSWIKDTFDSVVADYDVAAYHWELDQGDNVLTEEMESTLPKQQIEILKQYDANGYVPAFVIGCKYVRIGNGYEAEDSLEMEEAELRAAIESLI